MPLHLNEIHLPFDHSSLSMHLVHQCIHIHSLHILLQNILLGNHCVVCSLSNTTHTLLRWVLPSQQTYPNIPWFLNYSLHSLFLPLCSFLLWLSASPHSFLVAAQMYCPANPTVWVKLSHRHDYRWIMILSGSDDNSGSCLNQNQIRTDRQTVGLRFRWESVFLTFA